MNKQIDNKETKTKPCTIQNASERHPLIYSIWSCKVSWCEKCKKHFYNDRNEVHTTKATDEHYHEIDNKETKTKPELYADLGVVRVRMDDFIIHLDTRRHRIKFQAYPVQDWTHVPTGKEVTRYIDKENEPDEREEFEEGKCVKKLEGSLCWRGVWVGRLYFTDDEYWGEDIEELSRLYNDKILPWCKDFIKNRDPDNIYDD